MHTNLITYRYSPTCFGGFYDRYQCVIQCITVQFKPSDFTVNILSAPCGRKMSNYVIVKHR